MTAILSADVFPGLDRVNPLDDFSKDDAIPDRFGAKWYEHEFEKTGKKEDQKIITDNGESALQDMENEMDQMKEEIWTHKD